MTTAQEVKARHRQELMAHEAVVGVGIDEDEAGKERILVYVKALSPELQRMLPKSLEGIDVVVQAIGRIARRDEGSATSA